MPRGPAPTPIIIPQCLQVSLVWSIEGVAASNVIHGALTAAGPINPGLATTLFAAFSASANFTAFFTNITSSVSFTHVHVKDLRAGNNPTFISTGTAIPGTAAGAALSSNAALVVTHRTAQSGRGFRGRTYLLGLTSGALLNPRTFDNEVIGPSAVAFLNAIQSVMTANSLPMVVAQQALAAGTDAAGRPLAARPANTVPILSFDIANPRVDSQRRRLGR